AKRVPATVTLAEVTTDPDVDTPAVLLDYRNRLGATWELATGTREQVASFWKTFGVDLATGDTHTSTLALLDRHGYIRLVYRGAPSIGNDIPPSLVTSLSAAGLRQLASGGDGWGAPDVLQSLLTIAGPEQSPQPAGGHAPGFKLASTGGGTVSLAALAGKPLVINFWRGDCPPCRAEMPLLQQRVGPQSKVQLVLINWGESAVAARSFLSRVGINQGSLLGCPDWPLCHGRPYPTADIHSIIEYSHRSVGTITGVLLIGTVALAWVVFRQRRPLVAWLATASLVAIAAEGALGAVVVANELASWLVLVHLGLAMIIIGFLI